ncbi:hypothetical protein CANARDRAFT_28984 [[Candida] arabinofermentans NRRL YB-2248]|uniref:Telomere length regulation protein conserved domain-containing protein n=1 Tax=[Candida] arabinofermentans NRRL YB-2248 TaxID=983967 RepID=A0A1E4SZC0_9ASCO|nr:hypothetical protein CANARDRAFT_28984 [[Candida] arabinofermentans NRRL YB-2248]
MSDVEKVERLREKLEGQPSIEELRSVLDQLTNLRKNDLITLEIVSTLINYTIREIYTSLNDNQVHLQLVGLLTNRIGISQLLLKLKADPSELCYAKILADTVISKDFQGLFSNLTRLNFKEVKALVNHKILEALNQSYIETKDDALDQVTRNYRNIVFKHLIDAEIENTDFYWQFMNACLPVNLFFENERYNKLLTTRYHKLKDITFIKKLVSYLKGRITDENIKAYATLVSLLAINEWDAVINFVLNLHDVGCAKLIIYLASEQGSSKTINRHLIRALTTFGSKQYIMQTSTITQEFSTRCIVILIHYSNDDSISALSRDSLFLEAMTNRLESNGEKLRFFGMIIGDLVHERLDGKPLFDIVEHIKKKTSFITEIGLFLKHHDEVMKNPYPIIKSSTLANISHGDYEEKNVMLTSDKLTNSRVDSDPEDSDDEEYVTTSIKKTVPTPVYLKELISYLESDRQKDQLCYEKHQLAFSILPNLVRTKHQSQELKFYSKQLLELIMNWDNIYGFENFESWQLSSMISVTVGEFDSSIEYLVTAFFSGDLSLSKRVMILSCLGLSCRELSGFDDNFVSGKNTIENLGPQKLPEHLHQQFLAYESEENQAQLKQLETMIQAVEEFKMSGTVIRRSSKLNKIESKTKTKDTKFINKKLPKLFYMLISVFQTIHSKTSSGFQIGHFSSILNSQYLRTLSIILNCGIPSSTELVEMVSELLIIVIDQLRVQCLKFENDIFESILICLKTVFQVDSKSLLKHSFGQELITINESLMYIYSSGLIIDASVQNNCAFIVNKIEECLR